MKRRSWVVLIAIVLAAGWSIWIYRERQPPPTQSKEQVVSEIDANLSGLTSKGFSGAVLLAQDGMVLLHKTYGLADRSSGRPITTSTGFDIGSLVKPFTATAILKLESQGKLQRSNSIALFFPNAPPDKAPITVQQLLTHSSGLPDIVDANWNPLAYVPDFDYIPVSRNEIVQRAMSAKLLFKPGEKSVYSNLGFSLLGGIIEIASGEPYEQFLRKTIFEPAGMNRTGYLGPGWKSGELAVGYLDGKPWGTPLDHQWLADGPSWNLRANGGMISTADDLYKWIVALDGNKLLSEVEKKAFFDLNVHLNRRGTRTMGVAGSNNVFDACYLWYVDEHRVLVMLTNSDTWRAEKLVPDLARQMRSIRPSSK
jgi:CubicO group peptidase (beta-lactamase class C family)